MMRTIVFFVFLGGLCHITSSKKCTKAVDIVFVVDESGSITAPNFKKVKKFLSDVVAGFNVDTYGAHFGVIKYSTNSELVCPLNKYTNVNQLQQRILNMGYDRGGTNTGAALEFARQKLFDSPGDRKYVPNVLILFSDGKSNDHKLAKHEANLLKENGVEVLCVAIGNRWVKGSLRKQLQELASKPEYLFETKFDLLDTIKNELTKETCEAADPCHTKPCFNNGECTIDGDSYKCGCPTEYEGKHCEEHRPRYIKQGCFGTQKVKDIRVALFNRRDILKNSWGSAWNNFLDKIVNDCYEAAKEKKKNYFWVEFLGECYGVANLDLDDLEKSSDGCWSKQPDYTKCQAGEKKPICVGTGNHGFVYKVNY